MADNSNNQDRGFAAMSDEKQRDAARRGGEASSAKQDMSELGKKGAAAQPTEAKREGGKKGGAASHRS